MEDRLSVVELARRLGVSLTTVQRWHMPGLMGGVRLRIDGPVGHRSVSLPAWANFRKALRQASLWSVMRPIHQRVMAAMPFRGPGPDGGPDLATGGSGKG